MFQLTAARRRLDVIPQGSVLIVDVSTHSRPKAAGQRGSNNDAAIVVSTHSRPKAAGVYLPPRHRLLPCFNSQPPEGGWQHQRIVVSRNGSFNSQPPEGGWLPPCRL